GDHRDLPSFPTRRSSDLIDFFGLKREAMRESSSVTTGKSSSNRFTNDGTSATVSGPSMATPTTSSPLARCASYIARRCGNSALQGSQNVDQKSSSTTSLPRWSLRRNVFPETSLPVKSGARVPAAVAGAPWVDAGAPVG